MKNKLFVLILVILFSGCNPGPNERPSVNSLKGKYQLTLKTQQFLKEEKKYFSLSNSTIILEENGNLVIENLPDCYINGFGDSHNGFVSGKGKWEIEKYGSDFGISFNISKGYSMEPGIYAGTLIKNKVAPFILQLNVGDPDSGENLFYEKQL